MSMYPIASYVVSGSSTTTFSFTNIPQNFTHLQIRASWNAQVNTSGNSAHMQFNSDSAANYSYHYLLGTGSGVVGGGTGGSNVILFSNYPWVSGSSSAYTASSIMEILDYSNTSKTKVAKISNGYDTGTGIQGSWMFSGAWYNTAAITSITLTSPGSGNYFTNSSRFDLYGISTSSATGA